MCGMMNMNYEELNCVIFSIVLPLSLQEFGYFHRPDPKYPESISLTYDEISICMSP
jgi:hypothetical protein